MIEIDSEGDESTIECKAVQKTRWQLIVKNSRDEVVRTEISDNPKKLLRQGRTTPGGTHVEVTQADPDQSSS